MARIEQEALALPAEERVQLADRLWESVQGGTPTELVMTPELERMLDEGLEGLEESKSTDQIRRGS
ncbi:MAG: addiction module antitoxin RelB [Verrucomicrobiales bacterium]|nr:addiction module antitoxin RelB [Verrucomicrobiales bacterium]